MRSALIILNTLQAVIASDANFSSKNFVRRRQRVYPTEGTCGASQLMDFISGSVVGPLWRQQKQIEALTAGLQKVSTEFELSKTSPRTVSNNQ
jgi:hypothetical protein